MERAAKSTVILLIYIDSIAFVMGSAILAHGFGVDSSKTICTQAVVLCLACYMTTKVFIYVSIPRAIIPCWDCLKWNKTWLPLETCCFPLETVSLLLKATLKK